MMTNLFSIFDPSSSLPLMTNWISLMFWMIILPSSVFLLKSTAFLFFNSVMKKVFSEMKIILMNKEHHTVLLLASLFGLIMIVNLSGLLPFIFTPSSHLSVSVSLALPIWVSFMFYGILKAPTNLLAHLVPLGAPYYLIPFMVVIETLSLLIRPAALSIRLTANMIAGHLLLSLLGSYGVIFSVSLSSVVILSSILLLFLELAVAVVQAYVFTILLTLYISEI